MRTFAVYALAVATLFCSPAITSAQDEEAEEVEEEGSDIDDLMSSDPERAEPEPEAEQDGDEGAPAESADESLGLSDDERPPGDEPSAEEEPEDTEVDAEASSGGPDRPLSVGVLAGAGFGLESGAADPWGLGFGVRGGYNLGGFYIGGRFVYYLGETTTVVNPAFGGGTRTVELDANLWELGVEAGYDIRAGEVVVIRPGLGVGFAGVSGNRTQTAAFIAPGLSLLFDVAPGFFLGLDTRYQLVATEISISGLTLLANVGMRF
jgi:hypothetical protein